MALSCMLMLLDLATLEMCEFTNDEADDDLLNSEDFAILEKEVSDTKLKNRLV